MLEIYAGLVLLGCLLGLGGRALWLLVASALAIAAIITLGILQSRTALEIAGNCALAMAALQPAFVLMSLVIAPAWRRRAAKAAERDRSRDPALKAALEPSEKSTAP